MPIEPLLESLGKIDLSGIGWVIVGGESGPGARPIQESWVVEIRDQCHKADVPFFFKQWGGKQKSRTGRELLGRTYDEMPRRQGQRVADPKAIRSALAEVQRAADGTTGF